jgi:hypothetical protein
LVTSFTISSQAWASSNLPLAYAFTYQVKSYSQTTPELNLGSKSALSYVASTLPSGSSSFEYALTIRTIVFDSNEASVNITSQTQVKTQVKAQTKV